MKALYFGLFAALLLFAVGCQNDDDETTPPVVPADEVQIAVSVNPDTIWFVYGETVLAEINVLVTDGYGQPLAGRPVIVHVSNSDIGEVDFELMGGNHSTAWDTTDDQGRAMIPYLAVRTGDNTVMAVAEGDTAQTVAVHRHPYNGEMLTINLFVSPPEWYFPFYGDTALITCEVSVYDELAQPVPGLYLNFYAQRGQLSENALTDEYGRTVAVLTATEDQIFPDELTPEIAGEVVAEISIFNDSQLILFRR